MHWLFLVCTVLGGTLLACQILMSLLGLGGEALHDLALDVPHDATGFDAHADSADTHTHSSGAWLWGVLSFRTLTAASAFFGLTGLATEGADWPPASQLVSAGFAGLAAMYGVHWMVRGMSRLAEDGTVRIERAVGQVAEVYLPIAPDALPGKVLIDFQGQRLEYEAITHGARRLAPGEHVRVIAVAHDRLEVAALDAVEPPLENKPPLKV